MVSVILDQIKKIKKIASISRSGNYPKLLVLDGSLCMCQSSTNSINGKAKPLATITPQSMQGLSYIFFLFIYFLSDLHLVPMETFCTSKHDS